MTAAAEAAANIGSSFGSWNDDAAGLPIFNYSLDQVKDAELGIHSLAGKYHREADPDGDRGSWNASDHLFQCGNDRLILLASNYGYVQVRSDESGPKLLNDFDAEGHQYGGGLAYLLEDGQEVASTYFSRKSADMLREYGLGYVSKQVKHNGTILSQRLIVPFGDDPVVVSEIVIENSRSELRKFDLFESWSLRFLHLSTCQPNCTTLPWNATLHQQFAQRRKYQRQHFSTSFSQQQGGDYFYQVANTRKIASPTASSQAMWDSYPPSTFLAAVGNYSRGAQFGCEGMEFFGPKGPTAPAFAVKCSHNGSSAEPAHILRRTFSVQAATTMTLYSVFGYAPHQLSKSNGTTSQKRNYTPRALVGKYSSQPQLEKLWASTTASWKADSLHFELPSHKQLNLSLAREVRWHYGYLRSTLTQYDLFNASVLDQGTAYRYGGGGNGFEGAARDPLQHSLPLLLTAPEVTASVVRFTLAQTFSPQTWAAHPANSSTWLLSQRNLPYEIVGQGLPGPDPPSPHSGYNHLWRPSDLELYLLWLASEYVLATKDVGFLDSKLVAQNWDEAKTTREISVVQGLVDSFWFLRNHTATGAHGLIRALSGDWNDGWPHLTCPKGLADADCVATALRSSESVLNSAMAAYILPRFADVLDMRTKLRKADDTEHVSRAAREFARKQVSALRKFAWAEAADGQVWWKRGWSPGVGWIGDENDGPMLEPQPWPILAGMMDVSAAGGTGINSNSSNKSNSTVELDATKLVDTLITRLSTPVGMLTSDAPSGGHPIEKYMTGGAVWPSIAHPFILGLSRVNGTTAWEQWLRLSLHSTASAHPSLYPGVWTSSDAWGRDGLNWQPQFPMLCTHRHAWPLYSLAAGLMGIGFSARGVVLRPALPKLLGEYHFRSALVSVGRCKNGSLYGSYTPLQSVDAWTTLSEFEVRFELNIMAAELEAPVRMQLQLYLETTAATFWGARPLTTATADVISGEPESLVAQVKSTMLPSKGGMESAIELKRVRWLLDQTAGSPS